MVASISFPLRHYINHFNSISLIFLRVRHPSNMKKMKSNKYVSKIMKFFLISSSFRFSLVCVCFFVWMLLNWFHFQQYIELTAWFFLESFFKNGIYTHCTRNILIICWALHAWNKFNASFYLFIYRIDSIEMLLLNLMSSERMMMIWERWKQVQMMANIFGSDYKKLATVRNSVLYLHLVSASFLKKFFKQSVCWQMVCNIGFGITTLSKVIFTKKNT